MTGAIAFPDPESPLLSLSALEQARRIRDGSVSSLELVSLYLERIVRLNPAVGAFVSVLGDRARREAERKDVQRRRGGTLPPFHGVPTAVKDLHFLRGARTRMGSRAFRWLWSPYDDVTVKALKQAGFVILGKTATSEMALLPIVETDLHPPARNPWDPDRTAGGSSGGSGAAIAAGLVPIAPGSDGGGSIRIPSALCGLVGHKPSRGLVPNAFDRIDEFRMTAIGPMARGVEDAAALLDVLAAREVGGEGGFLSASRHPARRLNIGLCLTPPIGETDPAIAAATRIAADRLAALGHRIVERPPVRATVDEFIPVYQRLFAAAPVLFESKLQPVTRWFREQGRTRTPADAQRAFELLRDRAHQMFGDLDALLTPSVPILTPKVGAFAGLPPHELFHATAPLGAFTAAWNITGLPALTLPWGVVDGMPVGVQLVGRLDTDAELLAVARELESARDQA